VCKNREKLLTYLDDCWEQNNVFVEKVQKYLYLINGEAKLNVDIFISHEHTFDEFKHKIIEYHDLSLAIPLDINSLSTTGVFKIKFTEIVSILIKHADKFKYIIIDHMRSTYLAISEKYKFKI
jgi:hypothetical protein